MRIVYFGSSDFSLPGLRACIEMPGCEIAGVVTTPPQRKGRGLELQPTVVAQFCREKEIRFAEFPKLDAAAFEEVKSWQPEVLVVASYGKMIPDSFLSLAEYRFNIHPSLLPKYRGASPLNAPILNGETTTGLTIADITKDLDAGQIYYQEEVPLAFSDDAEKLGLLLSEKSHFALQRVIEKARHGTLTGIPQNNEEASYAPKLAKEGGRLYFADSAEKWSRLVRGLKPWPGAFIEVHQERVNLIAVKIIDPESTGRPGLILEINDESMVVQTSCGSIAWVYVKPAGKKGMSGASYARGRRWMAGTLLS